MVKNSKRKQDIKSKLIAAIAMLMVATIMMVSSTYAWFTLSTAPEVQGISTNVGSNGNLEIALSPNTGDEADVGDGDSSDHWIVKNLTWGNQLNLSGLYGLEGINLYPAQLNSGSLLTAPLSTPVYGADGRVDSLEANTIIGGRLENGWGETDKPYGVRVVGTSSSLTEYEITFKQQYTNLGTAYKGVQNKAQAGLNANGNALAEMAIKHANAGSPDNEEYISYLPALNSLISSLVAANNDLEQAIRATIWTAAASELMKATAANSDSLTEDEIADIEANYTLITGLLEGNNTLETIWASPAIPAELKGANYLGNAYEVWSDNTTTLSAATARLTTLAGYASVKWADDGETLGAGPVVTVLMDTAGVTINGEDLSEFRAIANKAITEVKEEDYTDGEGNLDQGAYDAAVAEKDAALDYCMDMMTGGIRLQLGEGSGIYADLAALVGNIHASVEDVEVNLPKIGNAKLDVDLDTTTGNAPLFNTVRLALSASGALNLGNSDSNKVIEDEYGYIVDFLFRTNATGSKLLLQTEATDRIYGEDGNNANTMGGGSTMTFSSSALNENAVKGLMKALRIVFFDTKDGTLYGTAKLDETSFTSEQNATTGLVDITADLYLYNGDVKADGVLCDLPTNTAKAVSALVYLDGANITNADVAASAQSMTGSMNLQFASDATLEPMENSALMNGAATEASTQATTETPTQG